MPRVVSVEQRFVESVDVVPTVLDALNLPAPAHRLEGQSLLPLLHGHSPAAWRGFAYSELDYSYRHARLALGKDVHQCRAFSLRTRTLALRVLVGRARAVVRSRSRCR